MAQQYDNTNRGQLWGNDNKTTENHPDFKGSINVDGVEYWLSAWKRKPGANPKAPALSMSVQRKEEKPDVQTYGQASQRAQTPPSYSNSSNDQYDDDIPF